MSNSIQGVHWFPHSTDHFITWRSNEINLYQVKNYNEVDHSNQTNINLDLSSTTTASLLASETRYQYIKCVAPSFHSNGELLLAAGLSNGKVVISNFITSSENNIEYTPRQSRPCQSLAWNELEPHLLAIGHDRVRTDHCITIWDTERGVPKESSIFLLYGLSETANSLCWGPYNRILLAGMSNKCIKIIDYRDPNNPTSTNTRAVHGLCLSPNGRHIASYIDNIVGLWDIRNFDKSIIQMQMQKDVIGVGWCPTRASTLGILHRDSPFIHLMDLHWPGTELDGEPYPIKRNVAPFLSKSNTIVKLTGMSWHSHDLERVLALSNDGSLCDFKVPQRIAVSWNNLNELWGSKGYELKKIDLPLPSSISSDPNKSQWDEKIDNSEDIAELIYRRALHDYGQTTDIQKNDDLSQNPNLKSVWKLLAHMSREDCMLGLKVILEVRHENDTLVMSRSDFTNMTWSDFPASGSIKVYRSDQREFSQTLCGWNYDRHKENGFNNFIDEICAKQEYTRAAMLAAFHLKIRYAIEILGRGAEKVNDPSSLRIAAIALSGFNQDKNGIWRSQCTIAHDQIQDPYLRAMFAFLTPDNDSYETVLSETGVSLCDRMAFSCMFLSDSKLAEYIRTMIQICTEHGDLNGLLLTGATNEGINLLQSHLDWTEDVQTVSLIAIQFFAREFLSDTRVQYWISSYRDLLDTWGLWEQRAELDIKMGKIKSPPRASRSVFLLCSFCGKSVSAALQEESRVRANTSNVNKLSSCPHCRKPLPRCSLCLLHMGTITGFQSQSQSGVGWQSRLFAKWFSWCQTCRHGGHTEHLAEWFSEHTECPVTSCTCKCFAADLPMPQFPRELS